MKTIRVSATQARNDFFNLLNQVIYEGVEVVVEKAGASKTVKLTAAPTKDEIHEERMKILKETYGIWKDVPESNFYDDRLHGKRGKEFLENLRKGHV